MLKSPSFNVSTVSDRELQITRAFESSRQAVWDAMTKPELLKRWLFGPDGWSMTQCTEDQRVGGRFRWEWTKSTGESMAMTGVYSEIHPPAPGGGGGRIVRTETFEFGCAAQGGEQIGTLVLTEQPAGRSGKPRTLMTLTVLFPSKEALEAMVASGATSGMAAGYDRLEGILTAAA